MDIESLLATAATDAAFIAALVLVGVAAIFAFAVMRRSLYSVGGGPGPGGYSSMGAMYDDLDPNR